MDDDGLTDDDGETEEETELLIELTATRSSAPISHAEPCGRESPSMSSENNPEPGSDTPSSIASVSPLAK